jgi:hypothetical protein
MPPRGRAHRHRALRSLLRAAPKARRGYPAVASQNTEKCISTPDGAPLGQKKCHPHSLGFGGKSLISGPLEPREKFDDRPVGFRKKAPFHAKLNDVGHDIMNEQGPCNLPLLQ